ncbi:MAG: asparaginase, partial [Pseudomonadota bacterium]
MMQTYSTAPMAMVTRGGEIESVHDGWAVLVNAAGVVIKNWGDAEVPIYPRSALKPLQSLYLLACGCKLDDQQLALASASHHAELCHTDRVLAWLDQLGAGEASLACGADWPGDRTR